MQSAIAVNDAQKKLVKYLFQAHGKGIQAFFRRKLRSREDASDLAQEVYLRMLRVKDLDAIHNPEGYLFTIASNLLKEHYLSESRKVKIGEMTIADVEEIPFETATVEDEIDTERSLARTEEILAQLKPKCRTAVIMKYKHGLKYKEIADELGISTNMVKKYLVHALVVLRQRMIDKGEI